jgi:hypothetical protein
MIWERLMSPYLTDRRSWKRRLRGWGTIIFLCLLGAVAAIGVRVLIESVGGAKHTRYEMDVPPQSDSARHEREREERERQGRVVLEKEK